MLDVFLASLADRRMFVLYRLVPRADGKSDKVPVTAWGAHSNAQDPETWLYPHDALRIAQEMGFGIGIVIYEDCGIFCVDLDAAIVDGVWTPFAEQIMARFPGAAKEISASGRGGHILGSCAKGLPAHRTRRAGQGMEIYTRSRFIALTGTSMVGDVLGDHTSALLALIHEYYPQEVATRSGEWTTESFEGWRGGGTDEQIIQFLRNRQTARGAFGGLTFAQLWDGDVDAIAKAFPGDKADQAYNASSADQAVANHLAFGTGYNCERVQRLMLDYDCALKREKWSREDYLYRTILRACEKREAAQLAAQSRNVPAVAPPPPAAPAPPARPAEAPPAAPPPPVMVLEIPAATPPADDEEPNMRLHHKPGAYVTVGDQIVLFDGMIHVSDVNEISYPDGRLKEQTRFNNDFGGLVFQMKADGSSPTKRAWEAYVESEMHEFPRVEHLTFDPRLPERFVFLRDGLRVLNSYVPIDIPAVEGDVSLFLEHLRKMFPYADDVAIIIAYLAAIVQYKGHKFPWTILLQGVEGNGKTFISEVMEYCVSQRYTHHAKASHLHSNFNAAFEGKLLVVVEDVRITEGAAAAWETLKPMITNTRMEIEQKGVDKVTRDVCFNFIMNSNHKDAIRKTMNDRRLAVFYGAQQQRLDLLRDGMTKPYFKRLYDWARNEGGNAAIHHFLQTYPIPDELNPATHCKIAPITSSTDSAIEISRGGVEQELAEMIESEHPGFIGGWINSIALDDMLADMNMGRRITRNRRVEMLMEAGYVTHPGLKKGRLLGTLPNGSRPTIWIKADHPEAALKVPGDIMAAYIASQAPR